MLEKTGSWSNYKELHNFINSIGWAIRDHYGHKDSDMSLKLIPYLDKININDFLSSHKKQYDSKKAINNLWHAWYVECDLNFPSIEAMKYFDNFEDFKKKQNDVLEKSALEHIQLIMWKTKIEYSAWKFIKAYYAIFFYISSMLRIINQTEGGHTTKLNIFKYGFYTSKFNQTFFPYPFNIYLIKDDSSIKSEDSHFKYILDGLKKIRDASKGYYTRLDINKFTIPDALFLWRNRINYTSVYSFIKCYGQVYKGFFYQDIARIVFVWGLISEIFLIKCFGYDLIKEEFDTFSTLLDHSELKAHPIKNRFSHYESLLENKRGYFQR